MATSKMYTGLKASLKRGFSINGTGEVVRLKEKTARLEQENSELKRSMKNLKAAYHHLQQQFLYTMHNVVMTAEFCLDQRESCLSRVPRYVAVIASQFGLPDEEVRMIREASATYDLGKIGIPADILLKPERLTDEEYDIVKTHTIIGGNLLGASDEKTFVLARQIALSHHEHWDGSGYPIGLSQDRIPLAARIVSLADVFDALISKRPHREAYPVHQACAMIRSQKYKQFDPTIVDAFDRCIDSLVKVKLDGQNVCC